MHRVRLIRCAGCAPTVSEQVTLMRQLRARHDSGACGAGVSCSDTGAAGEPGCEEDLLDDGPRGATQWRYLPVSAFEPDGRTLRRELKGSFNERLI